MKVKDLQKFSGLQPDDEVMVVRADGVGPILVPYSAIQNGVSSVATVAEDPDIESLIKELALAAHPVNSYYWSNVSTNPATLFGGTWVQVTGRFLYGRESSMSVGATGGAKTVTLTSSTMPSHRHDGSYRSYSVPSHSHTFTLPNHTHYLTQHKHDVKHTHSYSHTHTYLPHEHGTKGAKLASSEAKGYGATYNGRAAGTPVISYTGGVLYTSSTAGQVLYSGNSTGTLVSGSTSTSTASSVSVSGTLLSTVTGTADYTPVPYLDEVLGVSGNSVDYDYVSSTSVGSGSAHENMPPYINAYCWRRTA